MNDRGLLSSAQKSIVDRLNRLLSNEYVLYTKTLKFHWNVKGEHFGDLHIFFRKNYEQLFSIVDDIAERVRALKEPSFGTLHEFIATTVLKEDPGINPVDMTMIQILLKDHELIINQLHNDINECDQLSDQGTSSFLTDKLEIHEKMAWMLRAYTK